MPSVPLTPFTLALRSLSFAALAGLGLAQAVFAGGAEAVRFKSQDDTLIEAQVFRSTQTPVGTVIALHGCGGLYATTGPRAGGLNARHQAMADMLVGEGYAVVFPDSLTPRGMREICTQRARDRSITQRERRSDALGALDWVRQQPWAKADKVALLGWSHGGSAVLAATDGNVSPGAGFAAAVAFYPGCAAALKSGYQRTAPLTLMVGELDDWTPPGPCIELGKLAGVDVQVYPNSYHDFDNPQGRVRLRTDVPNGVHPGAGVHAGPNPEAREKAYARLRAILAAALTR